LAWILDHNGVPVGLNFAVIKSSSVPLFLDPAMKMFPFASIASASGLSAVEN